MFVRFSGPEYSQFEDRFPILEPVFVEAANDQSVLKFGAFILHSASVIEITPTALDAVGFIVNVRNGTTESGDPDIDHNLEFMLELVESEEEDESAVGLELLVTEDELCQYVLELDQKEFANELIRFALASYDR